MYVDAHPHLDHYTDVQLPTALAEIDFDPYPDSRCVLDSGVKPVDNRAGATDKLDLCGCSFRKQLTKPEPLTDRRCKTCAVVTRL